MAFTLSMSAQQEKPVLEKYGKLVKATYKNDKGNVIQTGFFKDGKPHGEWTVFNEKGERTTTAFYDEGKKVSTWFFWNDNSLNEVEYENSEVANVTNWVSNKVLATNP